jgi:hypothetical protein
MVTLLFWTFLNVDRTFDWPGVWIRETPGVVAKYRLHWSRG